MSDDLDDLGKNLWTVNGFVWDASDPLTINNITEAERHQRVVDATTPRMAEDLARMEVADEGKERGYDDMRFFVTSVFEGRVHNADRYARFIDPDVRPEE